MLVSRCCKMLIFTASALYCSHLESDYYECSHCSRPCDTIILNEPGTGENNEPV